MREPGVPHLGQGITDEMAERDTTNRLWFCSTASILSVESKGKKGEDPITTSPNHRKEFSIIIAQHAPRCTASRHTECVQEPRISVFNEEKAHLNASLSREKERND